MDIEGSELDALIGAKNLIARDKPILAVCVYPKSTYLINIFEFIEHMDLDYKFYLRHYWTCSGTDIVLFAVS